MRPRTEEDIIVSEGRCTHRWLLETPNGPRVHGRCRICGTQRTFPTVAEDLWYGERSNPKASLDALFADSGEGAAAA